MHKKQPGQYLELLAFIYSWNKFAAATYMKSVKHLMPNVIQIFFQRHEHKKALLIFMHLFSEM